MAINKRGTMKCWKWKDKRILRSGSVFWIFKFNDCTLYCTKSADGWWEIRGGYKAIEEGASIPFGYNNNLHGAMCEFRSSLKQLNIPTQS